MDMTKPLPQRRKRAPIEIILGRSETLAVLIAALTVAVIAALPEATLRQILLKSGLSPDLSILAPPAPSSAHLALAMVVGGVTGLFALVTHRVAASIRSMRIGLNEDRRNGVDEATDLDVDQDPFSESGTPERAGRDWLRRLAMARRSRSDADEPEMPARRRADSHPDAPPRPPLMASRDLPPPPPTGISDASDRTDDLSGRVTVPPISQNGTTGDTSLHDLLFRFERGLSRRVAVCEAQIASAHLIKRMIFAPGTSTTHSIQRVYGASEREPQSRLQMLTPANDLADAVEVQLESALLTLRRLAEQGRR
jgi:hypothetical protein